MVDLGLTKEQFLDLTPAQFDLLLERRNEEIKRADGRAGLIASTIINLVRTKDAKDPPVQPFDFFPHWQSETETIEGRRQQLRNARLRAFADMAKRQAGKK